jgi:hypothetical protein
MRVTNGEGPVRKVGSQKPGVEAAPATDPRVQDKDNDHDKDKDTQAAGNDRIEISGAARGLHAAQTERGPVSLERANSGDNARLDRANIEAIRSRVETGYYETRTVTQEITDRLLELLGLKRPS